MKMYSLPCLLALTVTTAHATEPLGRLFFTPAERAVMERQKRAPGASEAGTSATLNGLVQRSSGRNTMWINGTPVEKNADSAPLRQRVGETLAPSGEVSDSLQGDGIVIHRKRSH